MLKGPLPAGAYVVDIAGTQQSHDAQLHFDLVYRHPDEVTEHPIASADSYISKSADGGVSPGDFGATMTAAAVPAPCDDLLILKIKFVSGTSPFLDFTSNLSVP